METLKFFLLLVVTSEKKRKLDERLLWFLFLLFLFNIKRGFFSDFFSDSDFYASINIYIIQLNI